MISIEWCQAIIRGGKSHKKYGDKYEFVCSLIKIDDEAYLKAAVGKFGREEWIEISKILRDMGVKVVYFERRGKWRMVEIK